MSILLNGSGQPEPPTEITRRLQAIHPDLSLRYVEGFDQVWSICLAWRPDDPRRANVQDGTLDPMRALDIIGYLPMGCGVQDAPAYLERHFRTFPREDVQRLLDRLEHYNRQPAQRAVEAAIGEVLDMADPSDALPKLPRALKKSR